MEHRKDLPPKVRGFLDSVGDEREAVVDRGTQLEPGSVAWFEREVRDLEEQLTKAKEESPSWYVESLQLQLDSTKENLEYVKQKEQSGKGRKRKTRKVRRGGKKKGTRKH